MAGTKLNLENRLWDKVEKTDGCWLWRGWKHSSSYGFLRDNWKRVAAHRLSYRIANGDIPEGMFICHHCDVRHCVNPDHLYLGTPASNGHDTSVRNRFPDRKGEAHPGAKLTNQIVRQIRKEYIPRKVTTTALGKKYGVCDVVIGKIVRRELWPHVA